MSFGRSLCAVLLQSLAWVVCAAAPADERTVVAYISADEQVARPILAAFEKQSGIRVLPKFDTEATKTAGLVNLLRAEKDNPRADVFWSSEVFMTAQLAAEDVLSPLGEVIPSDWPADQKDAQGRWVGFAARARVIVYSTERVPAERVPTKWTDLTRDWWKGRVVMADPRFGTTRGHFGAMKWWWDRNTMAGYYEAFIEGLAENDVRMLESGNAGVVRAIVSGEADIGMTDTDDVHAAKAQGAKVEMVYPAHELDKPQGGTLLIPNTAALVRGSEHSQEAKELIRFLISEEGERLLAESVSRNVPLGPGRAAAFPELAVSGAIDVDYAEVAKVMDQAVSEAMRLVKDFQSRPGDPGRSSPPTTRKGEPGPP